MSFFNRSGSVDEVSPEDNGDYVDYGDDCVPHGEEYDGNLPSNGLDEDDMYYTETSGNDVLNYEDGFGTEDHVSFKHRQFPHQKHTCLHFAPLVIDQHGSQL